MIRGRTGRDFARRPGSLPGLAGADCRAPCRSGWTTSWTREARRFAARVAGGPHPRRSTETCRRSTYAAPSRSRSSTASSSITDSGSATSPGDRVSRHGSRSPRPARSGDGLPERVPRGERETTGRYRCSTSIGPIGRSCGARSGFLIDELTRCRRQTARTSSRSLLGLPERRDPNARLLITTGVIGSGRTPVANRAVDARLGAIVVRTDALRKRLTACALDRETVGRFGEGLYGPDMALRDVPNPAMAIAGEDGGRRVARRRRWRVSSAASSGTRRRPARGAVEHAPSACSGATRRTRCWPSGWTVGATTGGGVRRAHGALVAASRGYESPAGEPGVTRIDTETDVEAALSSSSPLQ